MDTQHQPIGSPVGSARRRFDMSTLAINTGLTRKRHVTRRPARPAPTRPAPTRPAPVRLTRLGRVVVVLVMLALLLTALTVFGPHSAATGEKGRPVPTRTVEVGEGDTLWGIAADVAKPGETRAMVHRIEELNALTGPELTVGQEIAVPVG
jgi:LysM repeat protein